MSRARCAVRGARCAPRAVGRGNTACRMGSSSGKNPAPGWGSRNDTHGRGEKDGEWEEEEEVNYFIYQLDTEQLMSFERRGCAAEKSVDRVWPDRLRTWFVVPHN